MLKRAWSVAILTLIAASAATANAATHVFIVPEGVFGDRAFADVAGEPLNADVRFTIYPMGAFGTSVTVPMNAQNFATSPDLLSLSGRRAALVVARTTDPSTPSVAMLRQRSGTARDVGPTLTLPGAPAHPAARRAPSRPGQLESGGRQHVPRAWDQCALYGGCVRP